MVRKLDRPTVMMRRGLAERPPQALAMAPATTRAPRRTPSELSLLISP
jgi:hypothetical protein